MKQKMKQKIKQTNLYDWYKQKLFQGRLKKLKNYRNEFLGKEQCDEFFKKLLLSDEPCMVSRLGSTELKVLESYDKKNKYTENLKYRIMNNSGVFPNDDEILNQFSELYFKSCNQIDLLGIWLNPYEDKITNKYCKHSKITRLINLEPYFSLNPWSKYLKNKRVLVVHPFSQSIEKQYTNHKLLFDNKEVLPEFNLITYPAIQSLGGNSDYTSWFEALNKMKGDIQNIDFDIAIIGAGAYGLPLASYVKELGKKSIHLGGATQMLFGIYGQRWKTLSAFQNIINEHWVRPQENEKPKSANKVENACYW